MGGRLGITQVRRNHDSVRQVTTSKMVCKHIKRIQVISWHTKEAMHLSGMQCHRQNAIGTGSL